MNFRKIGILLALGTALIATAAYAIHSGTTGTEKRFQQQGVRMGVPVMVNKTATASGSVATLNAAGAGIITTDSLSGTAYQLTVTNDIVGSADFILASIYKLSMTTGTPVISTISPNAGSFTVVISNTGSGTFNGTLRLGFIVIKQTALDAD